ncbi:hypothetical protein RRG08_001751 [Elysia crispata]|uniref:Fibrinogen C-terminal domain-containing protein n=1 Tax=Elysia crispata TaxID=231223 RepID=A0AAE1AK20_9GAST|nr:hypothetical protein RRG08_001751 [Elysia crispata]
MSRKAQNKPTTDGSLNELPECLWVRFGVQFATSLEPVLCIGKLDFLCSLDGSLCAPVCRFRISFPFEHCGFRNQRMGRAVGLVAAVVVLASLLLAMEGSTLAEITDFESLKTAFLSMSTAFDNLEARVKKLEDDKHTYELRVDVHTKDGLQLFNTYKPFRIESENDLYRLRLGSLSGGTLGEMPGDGFSHTNNMAFTTSDRDNDMFDAVNCASSGGGGFWYKACAHIYPNSDWARVFWNTGYRVLFPYFIEIKIRRIQGASQVPLGLSPMRKSAVPCAVSVTGIIIIFQRRNNERGSRDSSGQYGAVRGSTEQYGAVRGSMEQYKTTGGSKEQIGAERGSTDQ